jgi:acetyl-CoA C-acetyltransferase
VALFLEEAGLEYEPIPVDTRKGDQFAPQYLACEKELELDRARTNVDGGAIALGHPLGATGAMILGTVLDELERRDLNTALVNLCIGGGMGTATIIERV